MTSQKVLVLTAVAWLTVVITLACGYKPTWLFVLGLVFGGLLAVVSIRRGLEGSDGR